MARPSNNRTHGLLLAAALSLILAIPAEGASNKDGSGTQPLTGYTHDTGAARLIVDDAWLASHHYHSLYHTAIEDSDNLWRGFFGFYFEQLDSNVINGFPGDSGWGAVNDFDALDDSLLIDVVQGYNHTSMAYHSTQHPNILVSENAYSGISNEHWVVVEYAVANIDTPPLTGGRLIYFYEGDLPVFGYTDDNSACDSTTHTVWEYDYDGGDEIATGISWLGDEGTIYQGDYEDWYTTATSEAVLFAVVMNPLFTGYLNTDAGVYLILEVPLLGPGDTVKFPIAVVNGPDDSTCLAAVQEAQTLYDSLFVGLEESVSSPLPVTGIQLSQNYPNPFGAGGTIIPFNVKRSTLNVSLRVYDLSGRLVHTLLDGPMNDRTIQLCNSVAWDGTDEAGRYLSSGTYFYRLKIGGLATTRKLVILR